MSLYAHWILPWFMDLALRQAPIADQRASLLADAAGIVLEIGFGTGLSLRHYTGRVQRLYALEPRWPRLARTVRRIEAAPFPVQVLHYSGVGPYPLPSSSVDVVTSMFTLCTIPSVAPALCEILRVLRPGGRFLFLEHGAAETATVRFWQDAITPCWRGIAGGCHFNRPIRALIEQGPFGGVRLRRIEVPELPGIFGRLYRGHAHR